jgi:hypothetical protein
LRRAALTLLAATIALVAVASAFASPKFSATFHMAYLTEKPGAPTGQAPLMTWSDPGAPNDVPKPIKRIDMKFHPGTRFDTSALTRCQASDDEIKLKGGSACPASSRLGSGHTKALFPSGSGFTTDVTLFNARGEIIVVVTLQGNVITEFRDLVKGRTISVRPVLPGGVSLTRLSLRIGRHSKGHGAKQRTYMRAPASCPKSRRWTTRAKFIYLDGSTESFHSTTRCRPAA